MAFRNVVRFLTLLFGASVFASSANAQFTINSSRIPSGSTFNGSSTENIDFGDVDLDGDWDCVLANGGDDGNDQNRIWINQGGAQTGSIGFFSDETSTRFPVFSDDSRDIEFVDFDDDGDLDIYTSNTAQTSNQGNRWWRNLDGGSAGVYVDETVTRWVGLGQPGSSVDASDLIAGTFIDWSCDCDFGDLDNDGDLDLVHSSYGGSFGGAVPTRLFLNDGDGHFSEFNPGGTTLTSPPIIVNGNGGIWCEGTQQANTSNSTGLFCDIASTALDIDVGDIDGDFDLDILHGARDEPPRMFANRLEGSGLAPDNGGALLFRDVTSLSIPSGAVLGTGHYEQEMGDLDGDGDLDVYGLNWRTSFGFEDITMRNDGGGTYSNVVVLDDPSAFDDNEGDFFDYDNDGDLDLYVANFSGQDKLYRNNNNGGASFSFTRLVGAVPNFFSTSLDADACDVDGDGDYDVLVAEDNFAANTFLENTTAPTTTDTHAPYIPNVEDVGNRTASATPVPVRAHVYDNAPYYITWYNPTFVDVEVDDCALPAIKAKSSAGQVFRGELPGNVVGTVRYQFRSADEYGNTGTSAATQYDATTGLTYATPYGTGSLNTTGVEPEVKALSVPFQDSKLYLAGVGAPTTPYIFVLASQQLPTPFSFGSFAILNVTGNFFVFTFGVTDANGCFVKAINVGPNVNSGKKVYAQFFTQDGQTQIYASSKGLEVEVP